MLFHLVNVLKLGQEPLVNFSHLPYLVDAVAPVKRSGDREDALICRVQEFSINILDIVILYFNLQKHGSRIQYVRIYLGKPSELIIDGPNCLLNGLFECPSNTHNLSDALHAATQEPADTVELLQIPPRDLNYAVIQTGLETSASNFRNGVLNLVQGYTETEFCCDECQRVSGSFRGKRR